MFEICVGKLYSLVCVYVHLRIQGTSKEAFVVDVVTTILANWQLHTRQYVQFAQNVTTFYQTSNKLISDNPSENESESESKNDNKSN
jgi:hypothetical protein